VSARKRRRAVERDRLDLLAAESYTAPLVELGLGDDLALDARDDFLAGVHFERDRQAIHWRREAPDWLKLTALAAVGLCSTLACGAFLVLLAWAF
jgi:hypothetical protein